MQSILQYRRFRRRLEGQIERHGLEKVASSTSRPPLAIMRSRSTGTHHFQEVRQQPTMNNSDHVLEEKELANTDPLHKSSGENPSHHQSAAQDAGGETRSGVLRGDEDPANIPRNDHNIAASSTTRVRASKAETEPLHYEPIRISSSSISSASTHSAAPDRLATVSTHRTHTSTGATMGQTLTGVDMHTPHTNERGHDSGSHVFVVGYQGLDDTLNPHNWSRSRRICYTLLIALIGLIVGFASSVDSAAAPQAAEEFHVSELAESLATSMYLLGFGIGAPFAAPLSETFGRNVVYICTLSLFMVWVMASALSPNFAAQLVFRFLAGFFGSTPLTCAGGSISDMWDATERTAIFPVFANSAFWGPILLLTRKVLACFTYSSDVKMSLFLYMMLTVLLALYIGL